LYLSAAAMALHPELAVETWRAFLRPDATNVLHQPPLYSDNRVLDKFINSSWAALDELRAIYGYADMLKEDPWNPFDPANQFVCRETMISLDGTPFQTGCKDTTDFPSMYIPEQCYPNPREQCALMFSTTPVWVSTYSQGIVRSLNLSIAVAFLNVQAFSQDMLTFNTQQRLLMQYQDPVALSVNIDCTFGNATAGETTRKLPCWQRVSLPTWTSECIPLHTGQYDEPYSCDYPTWAQMKYARPDLADTAPRVDALLARSDFSQSDTKYFYSLLQQQSGWPLDHKSVACAWLNEPSHKARWQSWITPPAACTFEDTEATVSPCDEATAQMLITYSWKLPKACVGGRPLPEPDKVACPLISTSQAAQAAYVACATVLLAFVVGVLVLRAAEGIAQWRAAAASSLLPTAASAGDKKVRANFNAPAAPPKQGFLQGVTLFRRHMPILQLFSAGFFVFHAGLMLLLLLPFVHTGSLTNASCWLRYSFVVFGLSLLGQSLLLVSLDAHAGLDRALQSSSRSSTARMMVALQAVQLALLIADASRTSLLAAKNVATPGGAQVEVGFCAAPSVWLIAVQLACVAVWAVGCLILVSKLLLRVHFSELFGRSYASVVKSKQAMRAGRITRAQLLQVDSIAAALVFLAAAAGLLISSLYTATDAEIMRMNCVVLVAVALCWAVLYLPSVLRARTLMRPQQQGAGEIGAGGRGRGRSVELLGGGTNSTNSGSSSTGQDDSIGSMSLATVLSDPLLLLHFRRFAELRYDGEALHFLLSVQRFFKSLRDTTMNLAQLLDALEELTGEFVVAGSKSQVNLSQAMRDATLTQVADLRMHAVTLARERLKPASPELKAQARQCLQSAVQEIYQLIGWNAFPRFLSGSAIARSQRLLSWAEGFDLLDSEEQVAMLLRLKEQQAMAKRISEGSQVTNRSGSDEDGARANEKEAALLLLGDGTEGGTAAGGGGAGTGGGGATGSRSGTTAKNSPAVGAMVPGSPARGSAGTTGFGKAASSRASGPPTGNFDRDSTLPMSSNTVTTTRATGPTLALRQSSAAGSTMSERGGGAGTFMHLDNNNNHNNNGGGGGAQGRSSPLQGPLPSPSGGGPITSPSGVEAAYAYPSAATAAAAERVPAAVVIHPVPSDADAVAQGYLPGTPASAESSP
jgi:hypothetical protein